MAVETGLNWLVAVDDAENEAMADARNTFDIAQISVVVFVAIVFVFVL